MRKLIVAASLLAGILAAGSASAAGVIAGSAPQAQSPLLHQVGDPSLGEVLRWRMRQLGVDNDYDRPRYRERNDDDDHMSRSEYRRRLDRLQAERRELQRDWRQDRAERRDDDDWRRRHRDRYQ